jgi:hypothetical protein
MIKTIDFSQARFKHLNWKFRLRNFLDGKETLTADQALSHLHCDLGKWYYAEGKTKYGHLPAMKKFEVEHEKLHNTVKLIQQLKTDGQITKAEAAYLELTKTSDIIVRLLDEAEQVINNVPVR